MTTSHMQQHKNQNKLIFSRPVWFFIFPLLLAIYSCKTTEKTVTENTDPAVEFTGVPQIQQPIPEEFLEEAQPAWVVEEGKYHPSRTKYFDLVHTLLDVKFDWEKQHLIGRAEISVSPHFYKQDSVVLDAVGFDIESVELLDGKEAKTLKYNYDSLLLSIQLDKTYSKSDTFKLQIKYTAKPEEQEIGGSQAITSDKGLYFINPLGKNPYKPQQIWTQGETQANSRWFPTFDSPNMKTTQEMLITVDTAFKTLSNGKLLSQQLNDDGTRTDHWKQDKPHSTYLFMMAIGKFSVVSDKPWNGIPVNYYVEPEYEKYALDIFGHTPEMLEFFSDILDYPYPWDKYSQVVVRDYVSGAMENTSASIFMEALQVDNHYLIDQDWDDIIAHELFHHWFGDLVTAESWANLPLNESFATYSEYLWLEHKHGESEADLHWLEERDSYLLESESKRVPMIRYHYTDREDMFDSHSYAKGSLLLHMLRNHVGDEAFFASLNYYLKSNAYQNVEIHNLRLAFEKITGRDLNWFFNQWFMEASHPELSVVSEFDSGKVELRVRQLQDEKFTPLYEIPVFVDIWVDGKKERHEIVISEERKDFTFETGKKPDLVQFDAETYLPCQVDYIQTTDEFIFQFYHAEKILARKDALEQLESDISNDAKIRDVFIDALSDSLWKIREIATAAFAEYPKEAEDFEDINNMIREIANNESKSLVRAEAINTLTSLGNQNIDIVEKALQDSSYTVVATALYGYANLGGENPIGKVEQFEEVDDLTILLTLADFYGYFSIPNKLDWFAGKLRKKSGQEAALLTNYLGGYLLSRPVETQMQGVAILKELFDNSDDFESKSSSFQALYLLSDLEGVDQYLKDAMDNETNQRLIDFYHNITNMGN
ncbi:MAG: alanyl aminopeptidase [Thalassobius sp.]|nr:alanyl aminopeptidase [Thalassovita sp.]